MKTWSEVHRDHVASVARWSILRGAACACVWLFAGVRAATAERETWVHWLVFANFAALYYIARAMVLRRVAEVAGRCERCGSTCFPCTVRDDGNTGKNIRVVIHEKKGDEP